MKNQTADSNSKMLEMVNKKGAQIYKIQESSGYSTFSEEEKQAYTKLINSVLANDSELKDVLPIDPSSMDLFTTLKNGVLLCKLINCAQPGTIDERVINKGSNINVFKIKENLNLAVNAARSIGCQLIGDYSDAFLNSKPTLILGLLWQVIKIIMFGDVNIKNYPQLIRLLKDNETINDILKLSSEEILLRWFNFHLKNANYPEPIKNFGSDVTDAKKYGVLLNELGKEKCPKKDILDESDASKRAAMVLKNSTALGVVSYINPEDIITGNNKLNLIYTAAIFNHCHGLDPPTEEETYEAAKLLQDDVEGTREERAFRMWINSLHLDDTYVTNLYEDSKDGLLLLSVLDKISPGCVDWKKCERKPNNPFKKLANCSEVCEAAKKAGFKVMGIGGQDICDGNKKLTLAIVWQMMKHHSLGFVGTKNDSEVLAWANALTTLKVKSLSDKTIKNSLWLIEVMLAIEPRAVDDSLLIRDDESDKSLENNAKYAISIARKIGACVFMVWEDIVDVKSKMILTFLASLLDVYTINQKLSKAVEDLKKENNV